MANLFKRTKNKSAPAQKASSTEKHFQETATAEEWRKALYNLANNPRIEAPDISDEALRRENLYTREKYDSVIAYAPRF